MLSLCLTTRARTKRTDRVHTVGISIVSCSTLCSTTTVDAHEPRHFGFATLWQSLEEGSVSQLMTLGRAIIGDENTMGVVRHMSFDVRRDEDIEEICSVASFEHHT
jgi:hypothetical protein